MTSVTQQPAVAGRPPRTGAAEARHSRALALLGRYNLLVALVVAALVLALLVPNFRTPGNIQNVLLQASFPGLVAAGMTLLIAGGLFDLSVGAMLAVSGVLVATVLPRTLIGTAVVLAVAAGAAMGVVNGLIVTKVGIPAFIATLAMMNIYLAVAFIWTNGEVIPITSTYFTALGTGTFLGVPLPFAAFTVICVLAYLLLYRTYFGRGLRAIGSSEDAADMAGIAVHRTKVGAFAITGAFTGLAAVFLSAVLSSANGTMATGYELNAIAIAVVGGTALRGGQGTLLGTFTGALVFAVLNNALNLLGVTSYWQYVAVGTVLIIALAAGALRRGAGEVRGAE